MVLGYAHRGISVPRGQTYPPETKAAAITALMAGESLRVVSAQTGVPVGTLKTWWHHQVSRNDLVLPEKKADLGELVFVYLSESLATLAAQARFARDETWLRQQSANDLAILFGVISDKSVRVLAAIESAATATDGRIIDLVAPTDVPPLSDGPSGESP